MIYESELQHHGILGQRWGVRRYQNKDGSLTSAGKKRVAKLKEEYTHITNKQLRRSPKSTSSSEKSVSEMTNKEIQDKIDRLRLESTLASLQPAKKSKGQAFIKSVMNDVITPAAKSAGRQWLEKQFKDTLGLNDKEPKSQLEKLQDRRETLRTRASIEALKAGKADPYFKKK